MVIHIKEVDAFLLGIRPAVYYCVEDPQFQHSRDQLMTYPFVNKNIDLYDGTDFFLFFQNEDLRQKFLGQSKGVKVRSNKFHQILGETLGYPPKAVDFYVQCLDKKELEQLKVGMHYMGIHCSGSAGDLVENTLWLWDTYSRSDVHSLLEVRIDSSFYSVNCKDVERLKELQDLALSTKAVTVEKV